MTFAKCGSKSGDVGKVGLTGHHSRQVTCLAVGFLKYSMHVVLYHWLWPLALLVFDLVHFDTRHLKLNHPYIFNGHYLHLTGKFKAFVRNTFRLVQFCVYAIVCYAPLPLATVFMSHKKYAGMQKSLKMAMRPKRITHYNNPFDEARGYWLFVRYSR